MKPLYSFVRGVFLRLVCCLSVLACTGCERVELPSETTGNKKPAGGDEVVAPDIDGLGEGNMTCPYTVADVVEGRVPEGCQCWVVGHVVGYTQRTMAAAEFSAEGAVQSNILLAACPQEDDPAECVPVELNKDRLHKGVSLKYNPDSLGHSLLVLATVKTYFSVPGLRDVQQYGWLGDVHYEGEENLPPQPDEGDEPDEPEPDEGDKPDDPVPDEQPDPPFLPENTAGHLLTPVTAEADIQAGALYAMGVPVADGVRLLKTDVTLTSTSTWRSTVLLKPGNGLLRADGHTALFQLQAAGEDYRLSEWGRAVCLSYDVKKKNTSSAPLHTLASDDWGTRYSANVRAERKNNSYIITPAVKLLYYDKSFTYYLSLYADGTVRWCVPNYQTPLVLYRLTEG